MQGLKIYTLLENNNWKKKLKIGELSLEKDCLRFETN